ncbi:hypothetical protein BDN67DRAFT_884037, partial [Paxillus ammoniavirescens]
QQSSILVWLHTKHSSLNVHLHRMKKADTPFCPYCPGITEDVPHFLLMCPQYPRKRHILMRQL